MQALRNFLDQKIEPLFKEGGRLAAFYPLYDMVDTIAFTPGVTTKGTCHVRDGLEQKRLMITVVIALVFPLLFGIYNIGYQAVSVLEADSALSLSGWRVDLLSFFWTATGQDGMAVTFFVWFDVFFANIFSRHCSGRRYVKFYLLSCAGMKFLRLF